MLQCFLLYVHITKHNFQTATHFWNGLTFETYTNAPMRNETAVRSLEQFIRNQSLIPTCQVLLYNNPE